jgi:hypothetical protein
MAGRTAAAQTRHTAGARRVVAVQPPAAASPGLPGETLGAPRPGCPESAPPLSQGPPARTPLHYGDSWPVKITPVALYVSFEASYR